MTTPPGFTGVAHLAMTVVDMEATAAWWERTFGFERLRRVDEPEGEQRHPRILIRHPGSGLVFGIHEPHERSGDRFDPDRTGLDHIALAVTERTDLDRWSEHLDALGVEHSPARDAGYAEFVSFTDPDGIQGELWWVKPATG
ncbi:VOC family protein [Pseudonocardia acidicola]|uniref:VOC family protein n=1 Tax=Pseudonocardia acidicola TaxID=2724939 RepID=A0ABX1S472_9PSEU|nr:VOC family protein [Pseudonocardia acidicola]